jgi:hypothetical protein
LLGARKVSRSGIEPRLKAFRRLFRRWVLLDGGFEPAVEFAGRDSPVPGFTKGEGGAEQLVYALAGDCRDGQQRRLFQLAEAFLKRALDPVEQRRGIFGDVPLVQCKYQRPAFLEHLRGDLQILDLEPAGGVQEEDHNLRHVDGAAGVGRGQFLELVLDLGALAKSGGVDQLDPAALPFPVDADAVAGDPGFGAGDHPVFTEHPVD